MWGEEEIEQRGSNIYVSAIKPGHVEFMKVWTS